MTVRKNLVPLAIACLLLLALTACDDPSTSLVVENTSSPSDPPLRVGATSPDGSANTVILEPGASMTFRSLLDGEFIVGAAPDPGYVLEIRRQRDALLVQLAEIDVLAGGQGAAQRDEVSRSLTSLIERVEELSQARGYTTCAVELSGTGQVNVALRGADIVYDRLSCK